jgi:preprotein translocase subunit SecG
MNMNDEKFHFIGEQTGSGAVYGGAATTGIVLGLQLNELMAVLGVIIALAGFALNWYYSRLRNKREKERHQLLLKQLKENQDGTDF